MNKTYKALLALGLLTSIGAKSQTDSTNTETNNLNTETIEEDFFSMSLEDLLNTPISVASKTGLSQRESPGIVTLINQEEITNSGARDLVDVLRLVPGIQFGQDVQGVVGISMRGNWGHEGKVLMLIDGQEVNENLFSTLQFGNHYDVSQIKRIEIIRGPGSSIYGGNAELGVINIITKSGEDLSGASATVTYGQLENTTGRTNVSAAVGDKVGDLDYSVSFFSANGNRSGEDFVDWWGGSTNLADVNDLSTINLNAGIKYKGIKARFIYDDYQTNTVSMFDEALPAEDAIDVNFKSMLGELSYDYKMNDKLTLTPKFNFAQYESWNSTTPISLDYEYGYDVTANKLTGGLHSNYELNDNINIIAGVEYFNEHAENNTSSDDDDFYNDEKEISFNTASFYAQGLFKTKFGNWVAGGRVINHSQFGSAFAPRIGVTKVINKFHAKLLYSSAFRAPSIENINYNAFFNEDQKPNIKPERTNVFEIELGYQLTDKLFITGNLFDITINDPIVYFYFYNEDTDEEGEGYLNYDKTGSQGFEITLSYKDTWGYININSSSYFAKGKNEVPQYNVPGNENALLGNAQHKINLNSSFNIIKSITVNPSLSYYGSRYAINSVDEDEVEIFTKEDPTLLVNLFINYNNLFVEGLSLGAGVYDLFAQQYNYIQPYNNFLAPLPGTGREYMVRLTYNFKK